MALTFLGLFGFGTGCMIAHLFPPTVELYVGVIGVHVFMNYLAYTRSGTEIAGPIFCMFTTIFSLTSIATLIFYHISMIGYTDTNAYIATQFTKLTKKRW